jgi:DNA-binding GntR family transcriptional regulator
MTVNQRADNQQPSEEPPPAEASLVDEVYHRILVEIVRGELRGGTELKSTQLAQRLGVSRTPVIQALHRLAADGLVTLDMNKRAVVRHGAERWLMEIHEIRELLEPHAAAQAAERITPEALERLEKLAEESRPYVNDNWMEAVKQFDFELHLTIAEYAGNFALAQAIRKCWSFKRLSYMAAPQREESLKQGFQEHLALLAALRARDAQTARAAMMFHLRSAVILRPAQMIV